MKSRLKSGPAKKLKPSAVPESLNARGLNERASNLFLCPALAIIKRIGLAPDLFSRDQRGFCELSERLNDGFSHGLRISKEHHGVIPEKQLIIHASIA